MMSACVRFGRGRARAHDINKMESCERKAKLQLEQNLRESESDQQSEHQK